ncbi:MAG: alpha/beta fold hydrolase [Motiliproteus sp.]
MSTINRTLSDVGLVSALVLVTLLSAGCSSTTGLFFFPQKQLLRTPDQLGLDYQDVLLETPDGEQLHSWYLPASTPASVPAKGSILFLHGNAENISTHIGNVAWLPAQGYNLLLLDYRGYGRSSGQPRLPDVLIDIDMAARWLQQHSDGPYIILGQSLGAALTVSYLGAQQRSTNPMAFQALVLDAPFDSYGSIASSTLRQSWIGTVLSPAAGLVPNSWDPIDSIAKITAPTLFVASPNDSVVPLETTRRLFEAATEPKFWLLHQEPHTSGFNRTEPRRQLLLFLDGAVAQVK